MTKQNLPFHLVSQVLLLSLLSHIFKGLKVLDLLLFQLIYLTI